MMVAFETQYGGRNVRRAVLSIALTMMLVPAIVAAKREFQTGKLIDITADETLVKGTTQRWAVFTVQIGDVLYTARGDRLGRNAGDPGKGLIVSDAVQVAVDRDHLIIRNPNGKEMKLKITRRARPQ